MFWPAVSAQFKNQRIILFTGGAVGVLIYVLLHFGPWRNPNINFDLFHLLGSLIFLAVASYAGSVGHSGSKKEPILQNLVKLAVAALSTVIAGALIITALALSVHLSSPDSFLDSLYPDFTYLPHGVTYFSGAVLIYACSVLFRRLLSRPWLSALIGFAIGTTVLFSISSFWVRLDFNMWMAKKPVNSNILLSGALLLLLSWSFSSLQTRKSSVRFIVGISAVLFAGFSATAMIYFIRPSAAELHMGGPNLSPMGTEIVSNAYAEDTYRQIWTIPTETVKPNRIIKKHAYDPVISPDGRWFAFLSQKGIFGLRSFWVDLRVAKIDGTHENVVLPRFARWRSEEVSIGFDGLAFSPDSKYIALLSYTMIYVVDLEGNLKSQSPLPSNSDKQILGWRPNRMEVLLADYRGFIETYDIARREFRPLYQTHQKGPRLAPINSSVGIRFVVFGNELVDVDRGSAQPFPQNIGGRESLSISPDQNTLIYSISSEVLKPKASLASIHLFNINTGRDELCVEFKGVIDLLVNSPDGNRIAFEHRTETDQLQTILIKGNSIVRKFEGWALMGWRGSGRVVLADNNLFPKRMALGNIATGQVHQFYP